MAMQKTSFEINNLICSLKTLLPLANSHMVHFITQNIFESLLPKCIQEEITYLSVAEANDLVLGSFSNTKPHNKQAPQLCDFLHQTHKLSLNESELCLSFESLCKHLGSRGLSECSTHIIKNLMSVKKSHEVEMMSGIVDALARSENCTHIVDIGGGKGYLSSVLALKHNMKVLSIDSSHMTSKSAIKQIPKVEVGTEALFYRALLEVYLEKKLHPANGLPHFRVGKIAKKCSSFQEYVHKSVQRLGLNIQVVDSELQELYDSHSESRKQLHVFFLLRLCVAPAIEGLIMLDRLLYLREQGVQDAYLTQLFDPVVSPRCYAIVAFNKTLNGDSQTAQ
uniref:Methyltransferase domain-containing protein n=1 Tax=Graphocephala atropunctata TaxID=36148 RepID=A0A1B6KE51_9HEMI